MNAGDFAGARATIATLQVALDNSHARIFELEAALALVNGRLIEAAGRAQVAESGVATLTERLHMATVAARESDERFHRLAAQNDPGATQWNAHIPT